MPKQPKLRDQLPPPPRMWNPFQSKGTTQLSDSSIRDCVSLWNCWFPSSQDRQHLYYWLGSLFICKLVETASLSRSQDRKHLWCQLGFLVDPYPCEEKTPPPQMWLQACRCHVSLTAAAVSVSGSDQVPVCCRFCVLSAIDPFWFSSSLENRKWQLGISAQSYWISVLIHFVELIFWESPTV